MRKGIQQEARKYRVRPCERRVAQQWFGKAHCNADFLRQVAVEGKGQVTCRVEQGKAAPEGRRVEGQRKDP